MKIGDRVQYTPFQWLNPPEEGTVIAVEFGSVKIQWDASEPADSHDWYAQENLEISGGKHERT